MQYLSLPLLALAVPRVVALPDWRPLRAALLFCCALLLLPALQLLPLPSSVRSHLPGATQIAGSYALFDLPAPAWPLSLTPHTTWQALLGLLPPVAVFFGMLSLSHRHRRSVCLLLICFSALSVFLGFLQLSQGENSSLRFYEVTNVADAVGFFANRNHFSALLYVAMLFAGCWAVDALMHEAEENAPGRTSIASSRILRVAGALTLLAVLVMAQAMTRSRAGLVLSMGALAGVLAIAARDGRSRLSTTGAPKLIGGAVIFAILFSLQFALYRIVSRFETDQLADLRFKFMKTGLEAAKAYLPFGSGAGSFVHVYPAFEKPSDVTVVFANHAHNDVVEAAIEGGLPAVILMALFAVWLLRKLLHVWREQSHSGHHVFDIALKRAAAISLLLLALHSFVDYPLHTTALATVAAICCGLLLPAPHGAHHLSEHGAPPQGSTRAPPQHQHGREPPRHPKPSQTARPPERPAAPRPHERWKAPAGEWPSEWTTAAKPQQHSKPANAPPLSDEGKKDKSS